MDLDKLILTPTPPPPQQSVVLWAGGGVLYVLLQTLIRSYTWIFCSIMHVRTSLYIASSTETTCQIDRLTCIFHISLRNCYQPSPNLTPSICSFSVRVDAYNYQIYCVSEKLNRRVIRIASITKRLLCHAVHFSQLGIHHWFN